MTADRDRSDLMVTLAGLDRDNPVELADRLIAAGWTLRDGAYVGTVEPVIEWEIDEERLALALGAATGWGDGISMPAEEYAATIARAYRGELDEPRK